MPHWGPRCDYGTVDGHHGGGVDHDAGDGGGHAVHTLSFEQMAHDAGDF